MAETVVRGHAASGRPSSKAMGRKACFFEKKQQKTFDHFGFGLFG
jgi:hypothetical protein